MTEIETGEGKLCLASVHDAFSRRVLGYARGPRHEAPLVSASLQIAAATRGGTVDGVILHSDRGSEYTSEAYNALCDRLGVVQSMGRVGSALEVSRRRESHPPPLSEPCVNLATHTAPIVEPVGNAPCFQ
ncbi:hypothetical protein ABIE67_009083 [Streptomyces sp. V4I8]